MSTPTLKLGLPAGSLQEATGDLFRKAGYKITFASRSYYPQIDDPEIDCTLIRAQEMPRYVEDGSFDCGLTGHDWVLENDAKVVELAELVFSKVSRRPVKWVLAVPNDSPVQIGQGPARQADRHRGREPDAPLAGRARRRGPRRVFLGRDRGQAAEAGRRHRRGDRDGQFAQGEQPAHRRRADAKHDALHRQRQGLRRSVEAAEDGRPRADAPRGDGGRGQGRADDERAGKTNLPAVLKVLPNANPTISSLADGAGVDVVVIIEEHVVRRIVPQLKQAGATSIVEYALNKIID